MSRGRQYRGKTADRMAGRLAEFGGTCPGGCDRQIVPMQTQVVLRKGQWICIDCATEGRG